MKVAVVGDTHGETSVIIKVLREVVKPELLLFTGDHYRDGIKIAETLRLRKKIVVGNCDSRQAGKLEELVIIEGHRVLLTHGHQYKVKTSMLPLKLRAVEVKAELVCFGHTHQVGCEQVEGIWFVNPGSPTYPRLSEPSMAVIEITNHSIVPSLLRL